MKIGDFYNPHKLFTGIFIPESIVSLPHSVLSPGAKILFGRLSWHAGKRGHCFPKHATLAEEIGVSERSIQEYVKELEDASLICRVRDGNTHRYKFVWNDVLEDSLREEAPTRSCGSHDPAGHTILREHPHDSVTASGDINTKEVLREEIREEVLCEPPSNSISEIPQPNQPTYVPDDEPTQDLQKTVDTFLDSVHTMWKEQMNTELRMMGKTQRKLESLSAGMGESRVLNNLRVFLSEGGRSIDKFVGQYRSGGFRRATVPAARASVAEARAPRAVVRDQEIAVARPEPQRSAIPVQALQWNEVVSARPWAVWDPRLDEAMTQRLKIPEFVTHWPAVCQKCKAVASAGHPKSSYVQIAWVLKENNWASVLNGGVDWLLGDGGKRNAGQMAVDSLRARLLQQIAEEKAVNGN